MMRWWFVLPSFQIVFADGENADALNLLQVQADKHGINHQCAPKLLAAKSGMFPEDLDLNGAGAGNVDQCAAKCERIGSKYFQVGPKCICAKPTVTSEPRHPPNARWSVYSTGCGGSEEPAEEEEKCVPELYSKLNGMIPAILNYGTFLQTRTVSLEQCEKHCRDAGSTYFEIGTAGRGHSGNCICANAGISPPVPDGNANWNIYTTCLKSATTVSTTTIPARFEVCPVEGEGGTNDCPEGCKHLTNCNQCLVAAKAWDKPFSDEGWPNNSPRPTGCFRNRKYKIKCNNKGNDGGYKGKWPICLKIMDHPRWEGVPVDPKFEISSAEYLR